MFLSRFSFVVTFSILTATWFGSTNTALADKPNIVFVLIDDMGWPDLSCYGHEFHETPHIDRLASEGMRFTDFYAASPVCSSTRASIQTGQCSARVGITDFIPGHWRPFEKLIVPPIENSLPKNLKTIGDVVKSAGYKTGYFGKWHLGGADNSPDVRGYDVVASNLGPEFKQWRRNKPAGPKQIDLLTDQTIWFIEQNKHQPFFVTLSHHAVHIRVEANDETIEKYENKPKPTSGVNHVVYAAMVEDLDASIGRVVQKLKELKLDANTVIIVASDNGGLRKIYTGVGEVVSSNAPLRDEKGTLYEGGIRVPLIVRWPGVVQPGTENSVPTTTTDFLPWFAEIVGAELPDQKVDGKSLMPLLAGNEDFNRDAIYFHYPHYHHSKPAGAIRSGPWKLIEFFDGSSLELYNLQDDIGETKNVAEVNVEVAKRMQQQLNDWREQVGARMPTQNPDYDAEKADQWWNHGTGKPLDIEAMRKQYESRKSASVEQKEIPPPGVTHYKGREVALTMHYQGASWLTRDERQQEEDCELMVKSLGIKPGMTVCDMGCGNGFYTLQMAKLVGKNGKVLAVDIQPEMLRLMQSRAAEQEIDNITSILGELHDPKLPESQVDLILCVDVYHEFSHPEHMLNAMRKSLKPNGQVVLLEFRAEDPEVPIKKLHKMSKHQILAEMLPNGFRLTGEFDELPWQHMMFFGRADQKDE